MSGSSYVALTVPWHGVKLTRGADSREAKKEAATLQRTGEGFLGI